MTDSQNVIWTAPDGTSFVLKTLENEYEQKHIGEVKENPRTSYSSGKSTSGKKAKGSTTSSHTSVSTSSSKKTIRDSNDTFTDMGIGGRDISLDCYYIGKNHDTEAKKLIKALCQVGKSKLQLAYEDEFTVNVLSFKRKNDLKYTNATVVTISFHETSPSTYPKSSKSKQKEVKSLVSTAKENIASTVEATANAISTPSRLATFTAKFEGVLNKVSSALDTANNVTLNSIMSDVLGQDLISNSSTITSQIGIIFSKAASLAKKVKNIDSAFELDGYSSLFSSWQTLISSLQTTSLKSTATSEALTPEQVDELKLNDSIASSAIISVAQSLMTTEFETRAEAVEAAKNLVALEDEWTAFVDEQTNRIVDLEDAYIRDNEITDIVSTAANEILDNSFKLKVEQIITLTEDKTPLELAYEYYGEDFQNDPDGTLEYLIKTNNLSDDEFFIIPRGREVKIYV